MTLTGIQDGVRLGQPPPTPMGGRIGAGRIASSGSFRGDVPTSSDTRSGQRTPPFSGDVMLGVGLARGDVAFDCRFAEARLGVRSNPMLSATNPHDGALWRCGLGARYAANVASGVQFMLGVTLSAENALIQREITSIETITDRTLFGRPVVREMTTATFDERRVVGLFGAAFHGTLQYDPHRFVMIETGFAVAMAPTIPRVMMYGWAGCQSGGPSPEALGFYEPDVAVLGWVGAAFGPEFLRLALRANGSAGSAAAVSGASFGAEAALVFSTQVFNPGPTARAAEGTSDRSSRPSSAQSARPRVE